MGSEMCIRDRGIDPDNRLCKWCMRRVVAHLTQRALDGAKAGEKDGPIHIKNIGGGTFVPYDPPRK